MFKTHDNKLNEHDLSIGDCFEQLKEIEDRLATVETAKGDEGSVVDSSGGAGAGDLNELMNDGVFINGVVDNIMNTTNFASIIDNIIPLKEENEMLKQQVNELFAKMQQLEDRLNLVCVSSTDDGPDAFVDDSNADSNTGNSDATKEEEEDQLAETNEE